MKIYVYDRKLLERATDRLMHDRFAQQRQIPANSGTKTTFRKYNNLSPATTPLTEGITPAGSQLSASDISATIQQYGDFITLTDQVDMYGLDNTVAEATDIIGYQMGETMDEVYRDGVVPNLANKIYITGATEAEQVAGSTITVAAIKAAILKLKKQNAMKFTPMIDGSDKVGSSAIRSAYWGIIHPDVVFDLEDQAGFISAENYASTKTLADGEVGAVKDVRFCESNKAYINADGGNLLVDTYHTAIFGENAYGVVSVGKGNGSVLVKNLGSAGTADPLDQRSTVGFKCAGVSTILNDSFAVSIVSSSSQGANA